MGCFATTFSAYSERGLAVGQELTFSLRITERHIIRWMGGIHTPKEERAIGGLGSFKKTMDDIRYKYRDGQNILTLKKNWK